MKLTNITPKHLRCALGTCPAVFVLKDRRLVIVGKQAPSDILDELKGKVGSDETVSVISADFLKDVPELQLPQQDHVIL